MTGGYDENDSNSKTTTELVDRNGAIPGPVLPWGFTNHCVTELTEFMAIMIGGSEKSRATFFLELLYDGHYRPHGQGPDLDGYGRTNHACAHIRADNGSNYVIAAGGLNNNEVVLDTSEILQVIHPIYSSIWRPGKYK